MGAYQNPSLPFGVAHVPFVRLDKALRKTPGAEYRRQQRRKCTSEFLLDISSILSV